MTVEIQESSKALAVKGIRYSSTDADIYKQQRDDLVLVELSPNTQVAGMFTRNVFCAAPVIIAKSHLDITNPKYLLINAGNANAGTGEPGQKDAISCCETLSKLTDTQISQILPFSTGVIGQRLPLENIQARIPDLIDTLDENSVERAANAILTTDTQAKLISKKVKVDNDEITITGIAKGAGMIKPDMATMLSFIFTDALISKEALEELLHIAVETSFHRITVDGDTSTNDACILSATGQSGIEVSRENKIVYDKFLSALMDIFSYLAKSIIKDAEGATKFISISIKDVASEQEGLVVAYAIAHSPLVKTAFFASDPNWGRILAAVGRSGIPGLDISKVDIAIQDTAIITSGEVDKNYTEAKGAEVMKNKEIEITVSLNRGDKSVTVWTSDLSYDYVKINAEYRT